MPTDAENAATARAAICGAATGYPSTYHGRLVKVATDLQGVLTRQGILIPVPTGGPAGPWWTVTKPSDDVAQQAASRFPAFGIHMSCRELLGYIDALTAKANPPAPPASIVPPSATLVATLDYSTGNLDQWLTLQTRDHNGDPGTYCTRRACVRDGGPGHPTAARFEVGPGDVPAFGGGERAEVRAGSAADVREGDERYYVFSMRFGDTTFTGPNRGWCVVMQWHSGEGSPPLCLECSPTERLTIRSNRPVPHGYVRDLAPIDAGHWHEYVLRVKFSRSPTGLVEVWRDGSKLASFNASTMASASSYLKQGCYRNAESHTQVIWHDGLKVLRP